MACFPSQDGEYKGFGDYNDFHESLLWTIYHGPGYNLYNNKKIYDYHVFYSLACICMTLNIGIMHKLDTEWMNTD